MNNRKFHRGVDIHYSAAKREPIIIRSAKEWKEWPKESFWQRVYDFVFDRDWLAFLVIFTFGAGYAGVVLLWYVLCEK